MGYDIYIANKDKSKVYKLPFIPAELPNIEYDINNEEFKSYSGGTYNFIKEQGLYHFTLECDLPVRSYSFAKSNVLAKEVLDLLDYAVVNKEYIQVVIIKNDGSTYVNNKFSIESGFKYNVKKNGNYKYTLPLKLYRETTKEAYALGWNRNSTGWWYCYDYDNYKWYANEWKYIENRWYYFNANGYALASQWILWKNIWYYLDENCMMVYNKWLQINGKWYYFYNSGEMARNTTVEGYYLGDDGSWRE